MDFGKALRTGWQQSSVSLQDWLFITRYSGIEIMDERHNFIEVLNRRWCVTCDLFQRRANERKSWLPAAIERCEHVYAVARKVQVQSVPSRVDGTSGADRMPSVQTSLPELA